MSEGRERPRAARRGGRRWLPWAVMGAVLAVALGFGLTRNAPRTEAERVRAFSETVRCPQCRSQSVADSDSPLASTIREDISRRFAEGQSEDEVRAYLRGRYGEDVLLNPSGSGIGSLVWVLPVAALVLAFAGVAFAFRRWRRWEAAGVSW